MQGPNMYAPPGAPPGPGPVANDGYGDTMLDPGGFGIRFVARLLDMIATTIAATISGAFGGLIIGMLGAAGAITPGWESKIGKPTAGAVVIGLVASVTYHTVSEAMGSATIGKAICGLRVITTGGRPCTFPKALGRNLAYFVDGLFFGLVAWSSMSKSRMQQRFGDKWADTYVVRARTVPTAARRSPAIGILVGVMLYGMMEVLSIVLKVL